MSQTKEHYFQQKPEISTLKKSTIAIISAAGIGHRAANQDPIIPTKNLGVIPKQYVELAHGINSLFLALRAFIMHEDVDMTCAIINQKHLDLYNQTLAQITKYNKNLARKILPPVVLASSESRYESVKEGVQLITAKYDYDNILIHDAARPFVGNNIISNVIKKLQDYSAVNVIYPVVDTLRCYDTMATRYNRDNFYLSQTPQGFNAKVIAKVYNQNSGVIFSDDIGLLDSVGIKIGIAQGDSLNFKITYANDLLIAKALVLHLHPELCDSIRSNTQYNQHEHKKHYPQLTQDNDNQNGAQLNNNKIRQKVGIGFDFHAFSEPNYDAIGTAKGGTKANDQHAESAIILGGVAIPYQKTIKAHSDGDVLLHAVADAILGAAGNGSIGVHFPPNDERWKGAPSSLFVAHAMQLLRISGGKIINLDATVITQNPKIMPYAHQIRKRLASLLGVDYQDINIKAVTTEKIGAIGREEGIAVQAVCMIELDPQNAIK